MGPRDSIPEIRREAGPRDPKGIETRQVCLLRCRRVFRFRVLHIPLWAPVWAALFAFVAVFLSRCHAVPLDGTAFRVGFSSAMFTDVNENDARAAVRVWGQTLGQERGVPIDRDVLILKDTPALLHALRNEQVDALGLQTTEYDALRKVVRFAPIFVTSTAGGATERYVLLTHQDSRIATLADLRGRSLVMHQNPRACLAQPWLDTLLVQAGFKTAAVFFGNTSRATKLSKVVLPVFFRQTDACVATESGFRTLVELNPQVGKQLRIIATSPEFVPAVFCFRADYVPAFKERLLDGVRSLHKTPAGQQVLTIFQSERIEDQPVSCLDSALLLLARYAEISEGAFATDSAQPDPMPPSSAPAKP